MNGKFLASLLLAVSAFNATAEAQDVEMPFRQYNRSAFDHKTSTKYDAWYPAELTLGWVSKTSFAGVPPRLPLPPEEASGLLHVS